MIVKRNILSTIAKVEKVNLKWNITKISTYLQQPHKQDGLIDNLEIVIKVISLAFITKISHSIVKGIECWQNISKEGEKHFIILKCDISESS